MSRQDKHKVAAALRTVTHKSKILSRKPLMLLPAAATLGILALISVLFTSADTASNTYAANLGSQITTEVDGQYYVTLTAPDVNFSVSPSKNENAAKQRIDVNVETNVAGGAKLYLSMAGASNSLHLNGNIAQASPVIAAVPDGTDASSFPANTWGYSTDDQTYSAVPTTASDPALLANIDGETTGTTSGSVISASIPVYYAANVDTSIQPGSYSNRMTYSAVVDGGIVTEATLDKITIGNGAEIENMQPGVENTLEITTNLMPNSYGIPRVYYTSTDPEGYQECTDVFVAKNESGYMTITCKVTPTQAATGVTLYIVPKGSSDDVFCTDSTYRPNTSECDAGSWQWGKIMVDNLVIINIQMQDFTTSICNNISVNYQLQLIDSRDGKMYWVGKLPDNNCWMTQNLDLNLSTGTPLTPSDTNISSNWTPPISTIRSSSCWDREDDTGYSCDPGDRYYEDTSGSDSHYHVGNYYQGYTATLGYTGTSQSICPKGWTLPSRTQFQQLINSGLSGDNFMNAPYYFIRGGTVYMGIGSGSGEYYASNSNSGEAYYLEIGESGYVSVASGWGYGGGHSGRSVRCIISP